MRRAFGESVPVVSRESTTVDKDGPVKRVLLSGFALVATLGVLKLLIHFLFNSYYGYQRDELYFIACGEHLAIGYVDIGPLPMWLGRLARETMGESLFALRFFSAVAGALTVLVTGLMTRELGGGRFGQGIASFCVIIAPAWLLAGNILSLPSFEPLYWGLCAYLVIRVVKTQNARLWIWVGLVSGIGLLNKPSMAFFGLALCVGLALTPHRRYFADKWLWTGGAVAFLVFLPNLIWQVQHGFPTLEFMAGLNRDIMSRISAFEFLVGQVFYMHPLNAPIWLAGLGYYFLTKDGKPYRLLGWTYLVVLVFLLLAKSKIYYLAPAYPMLLAAGGLVFERFVAAESRRWMRCAVPGALALGGLITAPVGLPILPIEKLDGYVKGVSGGLIKNSYELTGVFHDQFGWENKVAVVAGVFRSLPPEDQAECMVYGKDFGSAGAIDFYGKAYGLPNATSHHQNYYFWGPPKDRGKVAVVCGGRIEDVRMVYDDVQVAAVATCPHAVRHEQKTPIYLCRKPKTSLADLWPSLRSIAFRN